MTRPRSAWLRALRWPSFRRIWLVAALQQFGYWFSSIAFQWLVALETDNDAFTLSLLYFCMLVPILLFSLPAGVLADVVDRRLVLLIAQLAILAISTMAAAVVFLDSAPVWVLMACGFGVGTAHAIATPASQALAVNAVPSQDVRSAVVLQTIGMNLARIGGPALAGIVILLWGSVQSLLIYGAFALLAILVLPGVRPAPPNDRTGERQRLGALIRSGVAHARQRPPAAIALGIVAMSSLFAVSYLAQLPALAARVSDDPSTFLVLASVGGVGALAGVLTVAMRSTAGPSVTPAAVMLVLLGAAVVGLAFSRILWVDLVLIAVGGGLQFGIMTTCNSVLQEVVDDDHRGRVMSLYALCWGGLLPAGGLLLGTVWHVLGPVVALCLNGCITLSFAGYVLRPGVVRFAAPMDQSPRHEPVAQPAA